MIWKEQRATAAQRVLTSVVAVVEVRAAAGSIVSGIGNVQGLAVASGFLRRQIIEGQWFSAGEQDRGKKLEPFHCFRNCGLEKWLVVAEQLGRRAKWGRNKYSLAPSHNTPFGPFFLWFCNRRGSLHPTGLSGQTDFHWFSGSDTGCRSATVFGVCAFRGLRALE